MFEQFDPKLVGTALAAALGMLIGIEREWEEAKPLGMRTFALLGAAGATTALLADQYGALLIAGALVGISVLIATYLYRLRPQHAPGMTTAMAAIVTFLVGALAGAGLWLEAVFVAATVLLLLHWKRPLHQWVEHMGPDDIEVIARFTLIALVILPLLPDTTYGPYEVFNPFRSWLLVVLIVGLNIAGYLMLRFAKTSTGLWLAGLLGGVISSTATTISYATQSKGKRGFGAAATLVILVASAVACGRVLLELAVVAPALVEHAVLPLLAHAAFLVLLALVVFRRAGIDAVEVPTQRNPAGLGMALMVAAVYVVILFAVAIARDMIGERAIFGVAAVSGLTDVDALTLSVAQLYAGGQLSEDTAWRAIFLATLSNLVFKTGAAMALGSPGLRKWILATGSLSVATGIAMLLLWP